MMDKEIQNILSNYIVKGIDPYFSQGYRSNLRYATKEYIYAVLMEPSRKGVDILDYLYFAKADLLSKDLRGAINALGNAKRAIHLLADCFLELLGLNRIYGEDNFPTKLEIIQKLDAFPTRLLKTLNKRRNLIEHEYDQIELDEAEGFVEIAELFVKLCYPYFRYTMIGTRIGEVNSDKDIEWLLDPEASEITVSECEGASKLEVEPHGTIYYNLKTKPEKAVVKSIRMNKMNTTEWLPILNTFLYSTQRRMSHVDVPPYKKEDYGRIMKFSVESIL
jgi:hypothetical protein